MLPPEVIVCLIIIAIIIVAATSGVEPEPEQELACSKCGATPIYIACPDHCYSCYIEFEWKKIEDEKPA